MQGFCHGHYEHYVCLRCHSIWPHSHHWSLSEYHPHIMVEIPLKALFFLSVASLSVALPVFISQGWVASWYCVLWYHSSILPKPSEGPFPHPGICCPYHTLELDGYSLWSVFTSSRVCGAEAPLAPEVPAWVSFQIVSSENILFLTPSVYFFFLSRSM